MDSNTLHTAPGEQPAQPVEQLSLLPTPDVPLRFRLDTETRRRGLRHIAQLREVLAERRAAHEAAEQRHHRLPPRRAA
ncbi:MAG: hypothetical protein WD225_00635 [Ilumatobacteraceae bacterium]